MHLIIGLGNPGKEYANTRHNAGFMAVDKLKEKWTFPEFSLNKKFDAEIAEGTVSDEKTILVKPQLFMNLSGTAVRKIMDFYKLSPADIIVIHDDLDIELGKYKVSTDSRAAGHNGVQDIIDNLGTQTFKRLRIGIAKSAEEREACMISGKNYVLQKFSDEEMKVIDAIIDEMLSKEF